MGLLALPGGRPAEQRCRRLGHNKDVPPFAQLCSGGRWSLLVLGPRFQPFQNDAATRALDLNVPGVLGDLFKAVGPTDAGGSSSLSSSLRPPETPRALSC